MHWKPVVATLLIAPAAGELLTSSTPPSVFFLPSVFPFFVLLYGCGALLIREITFRRGKGWLSILLLGASYGIVEEALCAKSFFDPHWRALGSLGTYGRWAGVNWVWAVGLTFFHAAFSIALTLLCVYLLFPSEKRQPWLSPISYLLAWGLFALNFAVFYQKGSSYTAPPSYLILSGILALLLALRALMIPGSPDAHLQGDRKGMQGSPQRYALLGFLSCMAFVTLLYVVPRLRVPAAVTCLLVITAAVVAGQLLWSWTGHGLLWGPADQFGLVAGSYGFFALLAPLQDFNSGRPDPVRGMTAVGVATGLALLLMRRRVLQVSR